MRIRGALQYFRPKIKPASFTQNFERTKDFFRDRRSVLWRTPLYSLAFFAQPAEILPSVFGAYALYRTLSLKKGDPRNWRKLLYYPMLANGFVPLAPLTQDLHSDTLRTLTQGMEIPNWAQPVESWAILVGLPILLGISRYIYARAISGKVIENLAHSALNEETAILSSQFLTAKKRIDRNIVLKTMQKIKSLDKSKFIEILEALNAAGTSLKRTQKMLRKLNALAG